MSDNKTIYKLQAEVCKALAHPLRIQVIDVLSGRELSFTDIMAGTGVLKSNLSQHLSVMTRAGILRTRREGQSVFYKLASARVGRACSIMRQVLIDNLKRQSSLLKNV